MATTPIPLLSEETQFSTELDQALQACPEVLGAIYMAHYAYVLQVCQRFFRQREDAEDAAAEVFIKLHKILDKRDSAVPFRPWVSRVAGRHCIDIIRQRRREKNSRDTDADLSAIRDDSTLSPLSQILRNEEQRQVREQVFRLPEHYKLPLILHYYKHMRYTEIARKLNRRLPAIKTTMYRAKHQLRHNLCLLESAV
jgi:RNA polymerase sigma-70 factor, ECF subfamily